MSLRRRSATTLTLLSAVFVLASLAGISQAQTTTAPPTTRVPQQPRKPIDLGKVKEILKADPVKLQPQRPMTLLIGDFVLTVEAYSKAGTVDLQAQKITGASGTAWLSFACAETAVLMPDLDIGSLANAAGLAGKASTLLVVSNVTDATKQISLREARRIKSDAKIGDYVPVDANARTAATARRAPADVLKAKTQKGDVRVHFDNVTIVNVQGKPGVGRITEGSAAYPVQPPTPKVIKLSVEGFTALIDVITLTPKGATGNIVLQLPANVGSDDACGPAKLLLGTTAITPDCEFYVDKPSDAFGPWIIGNTSLMAQGTGYTVDFSSAQSPGGKAATWKGIWLKSGTASGGGAIPTQSNTGYLAANYTFSGAEVVASGLRALLTSTAAFSFTTVDPIDHKVGVQSAELSLAHSSVQSGKLNTGTVTLPMIAVCRESDPQKRIVASYTQLAIQNDMDIAGELQFQTGTVVSWGELTHTGNQNVSWDVTVKAALFYLPAGPRPTFSPDTAAGFVKHIPGATPANTLADIEAKGMSGVTIEQGQMEDFVIHSPDNPDEAANPMKMHWVEGWLRVGHRGVDADLLITDMQENAQVLIGNPKREGYLKNNTSFNASFNPNAKTQKERQLLFQFCTSAVYDSRIDGSITLAEPCNIADLAFGKMRATSTANLIGGDILLPDTGVKLDYWRLDLVPTGDVSQAGVISVRTGRLVMTAAGIDEPVHFKEPFRLTWGEIRADGNLGELFFDYNPYGQQFDRIKYSAHSIMLSKWVKNSTDGYLGTCGSIYFNYFGSAFVNIHDARYDVSSVAPYFSRRVTCPKQGEVCEATNLHLSGDWDDASGDDLVKLDFPDATMNYNEKIQNGFIGTGTSVVRFLGKQALDATIEIRDGAIDICMTSDDTHDLDVGLFAAIGGLSHISGCIRIVGPTMERMALGGYLEQSVSTGTGIVEPKAGYVVEVLTCTTPSSFTFHAAGDMMYSMMAAAVDISGSVYFKHDFAEGFVEGDVSGKIDCNSAVAGLEGNGQITWYGDSSTQYLQGRVAVKLCSWVGGAGMEGGLFLGHNVPKAKAWVLKSANGCYGVSDQQLPDMLTGIYGYGSLSYSVNWYVFGGGVDIYAGMGAFTVAAPGATSAWENDGVGLPYVVGAAGAGVHGEILGGLVSASAWGNLVLAGPVPVKFEGKITLEGCVLWVFCGSVSCTAGLGSDGFYMF